jgi:hypothetical protein
VFQVAPGCLFPRVCAASVTVPAGGERVNCVRRVLYMVVPALFSLHPSQYIESRKTRVLRCSSLVVPRLLSLGDQIQLHYFRTSSHIWYCQNDRASESITTNIYCVGGML